jgi:tetratricopeptide (TPR) repeat protein
MPVRAAQFAQRAFFWRAFPASIALAAASARAVATKLSIRCVPGVLAVFLAALVCLTPARAQASAAASSRDSQICDPLADYFLGMEDYPEAIKRHLAVIKAHPDNALAYYHLGFAYGLMGDHKRELVEYEKAISLGLSDWQLFLNLGLLYLENRQNRDATEVLRLATLLGPDKAETHFNLGLAYERMGLLEQAEQQVLLSLEIDPDQIDAQNTLGAIYAEEGDYARAHAEWTELVKANPDYAPARANLSILERAEHSQPGSAAAPRSRVAREP